MTILSYTLSPILKDRIEKADLYRKEILLSPISPAGEIHIRWETTLNRIYNSAILSNIAINKTEVEKILNSYHQKSSSLTIGEKSVLDFKLAFDTLQRNWLVSRKSVALKDIMMLYDTISNGSLIVPSNNIQEMLDYIQAREDHPIIQAGIGSIGILKMKPFSVDNEKFSRLITYLFLYKYGYDIRGFLELESLWVNEKQTYLDAIGIGVNASSVTIWLEFFANSVALQLEKAYQNVKTDNTDSWNRRNISSQLNDRQKNILHLFDSPSSTVTNQKVQKNFKVSQITASRDLAKLSGLGLVFSHGKGRSVYYTRV